MEALKTAEKQAESSASKDEQLSRLTAQLEDARKAAVSAARFSSPPVRVQCGFSSCCAI